MGDVGACWDNAVAERFFGSLKYDWIFKVVQPTRDDMKSDVAAYIRYYNLNRLHTANRGVSPINFENTQIKVSGLAWPVQFDLAKWKRVLVDICEHICANEVSLLFYDAQHSPRNFVETAYNQNNQDFVEHHIDAEVEVLRKILVDCQPGQLMSARKIAAQLGWPMKSIWGRRQKYRNDKPTKQEWQYR